MPATVVGRPSVAILPFANLTGNDERNYLVDALGATLIDASSNHQLWAEHFTSRRPNVFSLQDDLIGRVVSSLVSAVQNSEMQRALVTPTASLTAYDHFLRGMAAWHSFSQPGFESALRLLTRNPEHD